MAKTTATPVRSTSVRQSTSRQTPTRRTPSRAKAKENIPVRPFQMPFDQKNMRIIFIGIAVIVLGYLLMYFSPVMSTMAITISPIILLLGYCVIVPIGIMAGIRGNRKRNSLTESSTNGASTNGSAANAV